MIGYNIGGATSASRKLMQAFGELNKAFPIRMVSYHACVDDAKVEAFTNFAILMMGAFATARYRCHRGTDMEVQYLLMSFGIPSQLLPISVTGKVDRSRHQEFLKQRSILERLQREEDENGVQPKQDRNRCLSGSVDAPQFLMPTDALSSSQLACRLPEASNQAPDNAPPMDQPHPLECVSFVVVPSRKDVCFGRGRAVMQQAGNIRFRKLLDAHRSRYEDSSSTKGEKSDIIREVVETILNSGGRFLKQETDGAAWSEVSFKESCIKVSHGFRNHKRPMTKLKAAPSLGV